MKPVSHPKLFLILLMSLILTVAGINTAMATPQPAGNLARIPTPDSRSRRVDTLLAKVTDEESPGAAVMVIQDGKILHQAGYGLANLETGKAVTPHSLFHLGSVGKQFTALGVMLLVKEGRVNYDAPIGQYLPELAHFGKEVTVRRLLQHTSGLPDFYSNDDYYEILMEQSETPTNSDIVAALAEIKKLDFTPGSKFSYNNTGYDVLGALIEKISGQSYPVFMKKRVFDPLGMKQTFAMPNPGRTVCESYTLDDDEEPLAVEPDPLDGINGSGSIYTSLSDFYFYDQALYSDQLIRQPAWKMAYQPAKLNNGKEYPYGFGWDLGTYRGEIYVGHSGAWLGFNSYYLRFPNRRLSILVLLNFDYADPDVETLAEKIADIYLK